MAMQRNSVHAKRKSLSYGVIAACLFFGDKLGLAGGLLGVDTALSAANWIGKRWELNMTPWIGKGIPRKPKYEEKTLNEIELARLVF